MRVLLLAPRVSDAEAALPLGLAYLASALEAAGHEAVGADLSFEGPEAVARRAARGGVGAVLATSLTSTLGEVARACRLVGGSCGAPAALGGPHATALPDHALATGAFAAVAVGEGEGRAAAIAEALAGRGELCRVPGIVLPGGARTGPPPPPPDPDSLAFPRREAFPEGRYEGMPARGRYAPIVTSRGCPRSCAHCPAPSLWGPPRRRSAANVADEAEHLASRGYAELHLEDDSFASDRAHAVAVCQALAGRCPGLAWACPNGLHPDDLDARLVAEMARSGCRSIALGIESLDPAVLGILGRPTDLGRLPALVNGARGAGMDVAGYFLLGVPGAPPQDGASLARRALALGLDTAHFSVLEPLPGSALFARLLAEGAPLEALLAGRVPGVDREAALRERARAYRRFYAGRRGLAVAWRAVAGGRPLGRLAKRLKGCLA